MHFRKPPKKKQEQEDTTAEIFKRKTKNEINKIKRNIPAAAKRSIYI